MKLKLKFLPSINKKTCVDPLRTLLKLPQNLIRNKILFAFFVTLCACQTAPKRYNNVTQGQWSAKALVKNASTNQSQVVVLDINAVRGEKIRMDITNPAGFHISSLVMVGNQVEYVIPMQKKYFKGKVDENVLKKLVGFPMDLNLVYNIVFDFAIDNKDWVCSTNDQDQVESCEHASSGMKIVWDGHTANKLVKIEYKSSQLQLMFTKFDKNLRESPQLFSLKVPESFKSQN